MIYPTQTQKPLDFDVSMYDFFASFLSVYHPFLSSKISYHLGDLTLMEPISTVLLASKLIYYPELCKKLRTLKQLTYSVSMNLNTISSFKQNGLYAMQDTLVQINTILEEARHEKSKMDARVNNLIYLYGQNKHLPILQSVKPHYDKLTKRAPTNKRIYGFQLTISGVKYALNYRGQRFGVLASIYTLNERELLDDYFENTKNDSEAITRTFTFRFLGGVLNTPIFAFRARYDYNHRGRKYYIDLADYSTYTRLSDVREKAARYTKNYQLKLITEYP